MSAESMLKVFAPLMEKADEVMFAKNKDYSDGSDVLSNFKEVAKAANISPLGAWLVYYEKHHAAIRSFVRSGGKSESEPIEDRIIDAINYLKLGWLLIADRPGTNLDAVERSYGEAAQLREVVICSKCGSSVVSGPTYCRNSKLDRCVDPSRGQQEHFDYTCTKCKFSWTGPVVKLAESPLKERP